MIIFPADLCNVTVCSSHVEHGSPTICSMLVADIPAVAPTLWTAPLSCVHVLIMMVPRSISRLSWLPLLGLAQSFWSREIPENLFQWSLFLFFFPFVKRLHEPATFWTKKKGGGKDPKHIHILNCQRLEKKLGGFFNKWVTHLFWNSSRTANPIIPPCLSAVAWGHDRSTVKNVTLKVPHSDFSEFSSTPWPCLQHHH